MSEITIKVKIIPILDAEKEKIANQVKNYFINFSSCLTINNNNSAPYITSSIEFLPFSAVTSNNTLNNLLEKNKANDSADILLIGIFRQFFDDQNSISIQSSVLEEGSYVFINNEPQELLLTNEKFIPFIIFNEFVNYLFFFNEKHLETHSDPCIRTIHQTDNNASTTLINSSHYSIENSKFCANCSEKILFSLSKLGLDTPKTNNNVPQTNPSSGQAAEEKKVDDKPAPVNLVAKATIPPPRRTKEELDPNINLSFAQRKQINSILKNLSLLKEPLGDSEYLEVRERFFEGKVSEQVFLQILKRKAK